MCSIRKLFFSMTMFPTAAADDYHSHNLTKKKKKNSSSFLKGDSNYGSGRDQTNCGGYNNNNNYNYDCFISLRRGGGSDHIMSAEGESRKTTENIISISNEEDEKEEEEATGSSSKDNYNHETEMINKQEEDGGEAGWLQLRLGSSGHQRSLTPPPPPRRRLVELDLLPPPPASSSSSSGGGGETWPSLTLTPPPPPPQQHQVSFQVPEYHQPKTTAATEVPTFCLQPRQVEVTAIDLVPGAMTFTNHHYHQQQYMASINYMQSRPPYPQLSMNTTSSLSLDRHPPPPSAAGSSRQGGHFHLHNIVEPPARMDFRVVDPPPRPHSAGVWFILQASQNQTKQPYLPQLPKSYLRIKDGQTTVRLLIKYLANKLKLDTEFEIQVTCKGQQLLPVLTLQHVRDNIWNSPRRNDPHSSTTIDHLMVLNYARIA